MTQKLSFIDLVLSAQNLIEEKTLHRCYDDIPVDAPLPHYHVEVVTQEPVASKTMWKEMYELFVHCFAKGGSNVPVYDLIRELEEAMTIRLSLPEGYQVLLQSPMGLQHLVEDEDGTKHAVMGYRVTVLYGYKRKV